MHKIARLPRLIIAIAWIGKFSILSSLLAPTYWEIMEDIALRIWPKTQINIEINAPTIPTAAKLSVAFVSILPIIAVSVMDKRGSAIPAIKAGIASLFIFFKLISVSKKVFLQRY